MSTTSDPESPRGPADRAQPRTQEIPVVPPSGVTATQQLPPHPGASTPAPVPFGAEPAGAPHPTERVDFVLGPPAGPPPPPPVPPAAPPQAAAPQAAAAAPAPAVDASGASGSAQSWPESLEDQLLAAGHGRKKKRGTRGGLDRAALAGVGLAALSVVLLELGLTLGFGGESYWSAVTLWSAFATVAAVLGLLALAASHPAANRLRTGPASRVAAAGVVGLAVFWLLVVLPHVATDRGFLLTAALGALGAALWLAPHPKG